MLILHIHLHGFLFLSLWLKIAIYIYLIQEISGATFDLLKFWIKMKLLDSIQITIMYFVDKISITTYLFVVWSYQNIVSQFFQLLHCDFQKFGLKWNFINRSLNGTLTISFSQNLRGFKIPNRKFKIKMGPNCYVKNYNLLLLLNFFFYQK